MDQKTEKAVRALVKKETREETALIQVNLRQMNATIDTLRATLKGLEEILRLRRK